MIISICGSLLQLASEKFPADKCVSLSLSLTGSYLCTAEGKLSQVH